MYIRKKELIRLIDKYKKCADIAIEHCKNKDDLPKDFYKEYIESILSGNELLKTTVKDFVDDFFNQSRKCEQRILVDQDEYDTCGDFRNNVSIGIDENGKHICKQCAMSFVQSRSTQEKRNIERYLIVKDLLEDFGN